MSSVDAGHVPFDIVHLKVFAPGVNPSTPDVGDVGVETVAPPAITVQAPVPTTGVLPANVAAPVHTDWSGPAADAVGNGLMVIVTESIEEGHVPLLIVQANTVNPGTIPVTPEFAEPGLVSVPTPETNVQTPVPIPGIFPANVVVGEQTV